MIDYTIFYKRQLPVTCAWGPDEKWDLFISAYVPAERTVQVFNKVHATYKWWLLCPEYSYKPPEYPKGEVFHEHAEDEASFII